MKAPVNGGINLSVLDGWWCEGFETDNGWSIGSGEEYADLHLQDEIESRAIYDRIEKDIGAALLSTPERWPAARVDSTRQAFDDDRVSAIQYQSHGA